MIRSSSALIAALVLSAASGAVRGQALVTLAPESSCVQSASRTVVVRVNVSGAAQPVVGGQFFLSYDPAVLSLVSATTGLPPFTQSVYTDTSTPGQIDIAVGVPGAGPGTVDPSTMAILTFHATHDVCATAPGLVAFRPHNPPSRLTDSLGHVITSTLTDMASIRVDSTPPTITCPQDVTVHTTGTSTPATTVFGSDWTVSGDATVVNGAFSGVDLALRMDAHDYLHSSTVRFTPPAPLPFNTLGILRADFNMQCGRFGCGSPRFRLRIDQDGSGGDSPGDKDLRIFWGTYPTFDDCPGYGIWNNTGNLMGTPIARYDTSDFPGGTTFDTYAHTLALIGTKRVLGITAVVNETCSASSCTSNCATTAGGRVLLLDNLNINGSIQHFETATATDNCTAAPLIGAVRSDGMALTDPYPTGMTHITWTATDDCGNTSSCVQTVTVIGPCGSADFNCDGNLGTDADIAAFFACLGGVCPPPPCTSNADFDGDGNIGTDADIAAFFRVLAGGSC